MDEIQRKPGNKNYTIFEEQLRKLPDDVLKKLDDNPDLLEAFAKRSLDDPDFYKAVQKGDLDKLKNISKQTRTLPNKKPNNNAQPTGKKQ